MIVETTKMHGMKVRCIKAISIDLTVGKIYDVLEIEKSMAFPFIDYRIVDDSDDDYLYDTRAFEVTEQGTKGGVVTHQI